MIYLYNDYLDDDYVDTVHEDVPLDRQEFVLAEIGHVGSVCPRCLEKDHIHIDPLLCIEALAARVEVLTGRIEALERRENHVDQV